MATSEVLEAEESSRCTHISPELARDTAILERYKSIASWNVYFCQAGKKPGKRRRLSAPTCGTCDASLVRPFKCLNCPYAGCWENGHVLTHSQDAGHQFFADAKSGSIFCSECDDIIYDPYFYQIFLESIVKAEEKETRYQVSKKLREPFRPWFPSTEETTHLDGSNSVPCQSRRGLLNLGQTCFLNVVLQCFIHNPLLRNYFLADKHNRGQCKVEDGCLSCEMDRLFTEIYSGDPTPYGPIHILSVTWRKSADLSGYAQQDAHEFFITALNLIHGTSRGSTNVSCNCIIHSTFSGQLQSDVKCERCANINSTVDPVLDISLELRGKGPGAGSVADNTLTECLNRFTQPEKLGPKEYSCGKCGKAAQEASKRLSIHKLPPVLSFQFKRFEHKTSDKTAAQKVDSMISFPSILNMYPYTTQAMKERHKENGGFSVPYSAGPEAMYEYELFAVINHEGQINNGHYTNFAKLEEEWYRFDDDKVTHSNLGSCLNSTAYMCFYVKRHLDYKPYMTPTYILTRETEAVREKELEREKEAARMKEVDDALLATL